MTLLRLLRWHFAWWEIAILLPLAMAGCASSPKKQWTAVDQASAADIAGASTSLEAICDRSGGSCNPAAVRSIEQSIFCAARAMSQRHGDPVPSGPACPTVTK